jgi:transcription antitermination protein NusB
MSSKAMPASKGARHRARQAAVQALYQWQLTAVTLNENEAESLLELAGRDIDLDYFRHLLRQIPLVCAELDAHLSAHLDRPLEEVDPIERAILRLGAFEMSFHPEIPYKVVVNEAIELTKTFGAEYGHRYVNAVLDRLAVAARPNEAPNKPNAT